MCGYVSIDAYRVLCWRIVGCVGVEGLKCVGVGSL